VNGGDLTHAARCKRLIPPDYDAWSFWAMLSLILAVFAPIQTNAAVYSVFALLLFGLQCMVKVKDRPLAHARLLAWMVLIGAILLVAVAKIFAK